MNEELSIDKDLMQDNQNNKSPTHKLSQTMEYFNSLKNTYEKNLKKSINMNDKNVTTYSAFSNLNNHRMILNVNKATQNYKTEENAAYDNENKKELNDKIFRKKRIDFDSNTKRPDIADLANFMRFSVLSQLQNNFKLYDYKSKRKDTFLNKKSKYTEKIKPPIYIEFRNYIAELLKRQKPTGKREFLSPLITKVNLFFKKNSIIEFETKTSNLKKSVSNLSSNILPQFKDNNSNNKSNSKKTFTNFNYNQNKIGNLDNKISSFNIKRNQNYLDSVGSNINLMTTGETSNYNAFNSSHHLATTGNDQSILVPSSNKNIKGKESTKFLIPILETDYSKTNVNTLKKETNKGKGLFLTGVSNLNNSQNNLLDYSIINTPSTNIITNTNQQRMESSILNQTPSNKINFQGKNARKNNKNILIMEPGNLNDLKGNSNQSNANIFQMQSNNTSFTSENKLRSDFKGYNTSNNWTARKLSKYSDARSKKDKAWKIPFDFEKDISITEPVFEDINNQSPYNKNISNTFYRKSSRILNNFDICNTLLSNKTLAKKVSKNEISRQLTNMKTLNAIVEMNKEEIIKRLNSQSNVITEDYKEKNIISDTDLKISSKNHSKTNIKSKSQSELNKKTTLSNNTLSKESFAQNNLFTKQDFLNTCNNIVHDNNIICDYLKKDEMINDKVFIQRKTNSFRDSDMDGLDNTLLKAKSKFHDKVVIHSSKREIMISKKKAALIKLTEALYKMDDSNFYRNYKNLNAYYSNIAGDLDIEGYEKKPLIYKSIIKSERKLDEINHIQSNMKNKVLSSIKTYAKYYN